MPPNMPLDLTKHIIAAKNLFFGTSYFLILPLPQGWGITRSYLEPDVHSSVKKENITWVEAGQTDQIVFHPLKKVALDLIIQIKRGKHDGLDTKGVQISSQGSQMLSGHPASYCIGEVKQGLIKKKSAKTLRLSFYCPELQRTLLLYFTGKCQDADLMEIYNSIPFLECH
jgi:hypothetical protein